MSAALPAGTSGDLTFDDNGSPLPGESTVALTSASNYALQLDGSDYATVSPSPKFTAADFTISMWFDPTTSGLFQFLFMRGRACRDHQGDIGLKINPTSGDLDFQARTSDGQWLFGLGRPGIGPPRPFNLGLGSGPS